MKKILLSCAFLSAVVASSQAQEIILPQMVIDQKEDTTQVVTIADIINVQELVTANSTTASHFSNVWGRRKYFNISYDIGTNNLKPEGSPAYQTGYDGFNNGIVPTFDAEWGAALTLGCSYGLHKKPIANTVKFNLDYTYIDLNVTHFKACGDKDAKLYDSSARNKVTDDKGSTKEYFYIPWGLEKWKGDYGMSLGPSITIAPFNYVKGVPGLHFVKLNAYYHIGYHVSILGLINDDDRDANPDPDNYNDSQMNDNLKLNFGHGLTQAFGFSISWKAIGIGYEIRNTNLKYQSLTPGIFGHEKYKFKTDSSRIYLSIRY